MFALNYNQRNKKRGRENKKNFVSSKCETKKHRAGYLKKRRLFSDARKIKRRGGSCYGWSDDWFIEPRKKYMPRRDGEHDYRQKCYPTISGKFQEKERRGNDSDQTKRNGCYSRCQRRWSVKKRGG